MGVEIDWSKAPEGATHYLPEIKSWHPCWVKRESGNWYTMIADGFDTSWDVDGDFEEAKHYIIPRPTAWAGEGLPPVGARVVLDDSQHTVFADYQEMIGVEVEVLAAFKSPAGFDMIACAFPDGLCGCFRAEMARTREQIAAEEREKAITELAAELAGHWSAEAVATQRDMAAYLYDAGYRKVTP